MLRFRVSHLMRIVSLLILISMGGCTYGTIKPDDVKEYRYFPEYRGYFPVVNSTVRPDWVLPMGVTPEGKPDYSSPTTRAEAEKRFKETADKGKVLHPKLSGGLAELLLYPATILTVAVVVPGIIIAPLVVPEEESPWTSEKRRNEIKQQQTKIRQQQLEKFMGIKIRIQAIDTERNGVPDLRIIEVASPMDIATFNDNEGNRSFAPSRYLPYTLSPSTLELLARDLPTYPGDKESLIDQRGDKSGNVMYTSLAFARFGPYSKKGAWQWVRHPIPLTLSFIVWAPGFEPLVYTATNVNYGDTLNATISLKNAALLTPQLADSTYNIWSLKERYDAFILSAKGDITPQIVDEARDLLTKGEAVTPDFPGLDNLRVIIALADGDRQRAVSLSHYLSHGSFFKLFYGLDVGSPEY